jgi:hypothetical protein
MFKAFWTSFKQRVCDLIIKNLSMKVEAAVVVTVIYLLHPDIAGVVGFVLLVVMWLAVVGFRYLEKVTGAAKGILPGAKDGA